MRSNFRMSRTFKYLASTTQTLGEIPGGLADGFHLAVSHNEYRAALWQGREDLFHRLGLRLDLGQTGITVRRSSRSFAESAERTARRRILRGMSWWNDRGCGPQTTPPPFHCGDRIEPWRARPVPF